MTQLLYQILDVLPIAQQVSARSLLSRMRKTGAIRSPREQEVEAKRLMQALQGKLGHRLLEPRYATLGGLISSADHNSNMEEIYLDLNSLYYQADALGKSEQLHAVTLESDFAKSRAAILKLLNDARVFALRKKYPEFNAVKVVDFNSSANQSKQTPTAVVSDKVRLLQLRPIRQSRAHLENREHRHTSIYTRTLAAGLRGTLSADFPPAGMVDQKPGTFWGSLVMADAPIEQVYETKSRSSDSARIFVRGPIVEIYLQFSHVEQINTVRMLPFGEYPIRVLDVAYRGSSSSKVFVGMDDFEPITTLDWLELNFAPVYAKELRVTVAQENPRRAVYHLPRRVVLNTDIFQEILRYRQEQVTLAADEVTSFLQDLDSYSRALDMLQELSSQRSLDISALTEIEYFESFLDLLGVVFKDLDPGALKGLVGLFSESESESDEIIEVKKYEYMVGMREIEVSYDLYAPTCNYASPKFDSQATVSEIQIEVDERHIDVFTTWQDDYHPTSTEWSVDLGEGRTLPIHPRNLVDPNDDIPTSLDERLMFDRFTAEAYTRHGGRYSSVYRLKQDGEVLPLTAYTVERQAEQIPVLKLTLEPDYFDEDGIYTVDYAVSPDSYSLQVLELFSSRPLASPDTFTEMGPDQDVILSKYPFIDYEVVNRTGEFTKNSLSARWTYLPPQPNFATGQVQVHPTITDSIGNTLISGHITGTTVAGAYGSQQGLGPLQLQGNTGLDISYFDLPFGYFLEFADVHTPHQISDWQANEFTFSEVPILTETQVLRLPSGAFVGDLTGANKSGYVVSDFLLGVGLRTDDQVFGLSNLVYEPLTVRVGGKEATNLTDYEELEHPAFSVGNRRDGEYEYIHAGRRLYFNQPLDGREIQVEYRWLTEYVQILGTLRCNKPVSPDLSPKVNEIRVLLQNMVI